MANKTILKERRTREVLYPATTVDQIVDLNVTAFENPNALVGHAKNLEGLVDNVNNSAYRPVAGNDDIQNGAAEIRNIQGNSVAWNQLVKNGNFANNTDNWYSGGSVNYGAKNNILTISTRDGGAMYQHIETIANHVYLVSGVVSYGTINFDGLISNNGAKKKISKIHKITSLTNYTINIDLQSSEDDVNATFENVQLFDLTLIYGAGNEPTTPEQFEADYQRWFGKTLEYEEYDKGSIRTTLATAIKTVGFNLWQYGDYKGTAQNWINNYILKNNYNYKGQYNIAGHIHTSQGENTTQIIFKVVYKDGSVESVSSTNNTDFNKKTNASKVVDYIVSDRNYQADIEVTNICINFVHSGKRDGDYEPHWEETQPLPITTLKGKLNGEGESVVVFPDGLKRAGSVYDEIYTENGVTKAVKRVISVDLGSLDGWYEYSNWNNGTFFCNINLSNSINTANSIISKSYDKIEILMQLSNDLLYTINYKTNIRIKNTAFHENLEGFKQSLAGTILYYGLAEPEVYILDNFQLPVTYKVDDFGTEEIVQPENSIAPVMTIRYGINAVDAVRRLGERFSNIYNDIDNLNTKAYELISDGEQGLELINLGLSETDTEKVESNTFVTNFPIDKVHSAWNNGKIPIVRLSINDFAGNFDFPLFKVRSWALDRFSSPVILHHNEADNSLIELQLILNGGTGSENNYIIKMKRTFLNNN